MRILLSDLSCFLTRHAPCVTFCNGCSKCTASTRSWLRNMKIIRSDNFFSKAFNSTHLTLPHSFFPRPSICNRLDRVADNRVFVGFTLCNIRHAGLEILSYASWIFERCEFPLSSSLHTFISRSNSIDLGSTCVKRSIIFPHQSVTFYFWRFFGHPCATLAFWNSQS